MTATFPQRPLESQGLWVRGSRDRGRAAMAKGLQTAPVQMAGTGSFPWSRAHPDLAISAELSGDQAASWGS